MSQVVKAIDPLDTTVECAPSVNKLWNFYGQTIECVQNIPPNVDCVHNNYHIEPCAPCVCNSWSSIQHDHEITWEIRNAFTVVINRNN